MIRYQCIYQTSILRIRNDVNEISLGNRPTKINTKYKLRCKAVCFKSHKQFLLLPTHLIELLQNQFSHIT